MLVMLAPERPMMAPASLGATIRRSSMSVERGADADAVEGDAEVAAWAEPESGADVAEAAEVAESAAACVSVSFLKRLAMVSSDEEEEEEEEVVAEEEEAEEDSAESDAAEAVTVAAGVAPSAPSAPLSSSLLRFMFSNQAFALCCAVAAEAGRPAGCRPRHRTHVGLIRGRKCFGSSPVGRPISIDVILTAKKTDSHTQATH